MIGERIVIAWNGSGEVRRAVNDAMPFLAAAAQMTILIVDDARSQRLGDDPGADIVGHLQRHEVEASVRVTPPLASGVASALLSQCQAEGADLLVIDAYSRPRTAEILFGGVTRSLLAESSLPLLLSR